ncbi:hypothetical protein [Paraburkholderia sp. RL17-337-BIB-A]|uniref:hypothetical protein n=1 Tax=Paraburkholderia sp. RL17-337-BIB-A TaxID=3031636 RepID=UPI0038B74551
MESGKFESTVGKELIQFGRLERAGEMAARMNGASALRSDTPVFVTSVDDAKFLRHVDGGASMAIGAIEADACVIITVQVQTGGALYTWLADPTDSEVWHAMDRMDQTGHVAFAFEGDADTWLQGFGVRHKRGIHKYRREMGRKGVLFLQEAMYRIASGTISESLNSLIADLTVTYSPVSILATRDVVTAAERLYAGFSAWDGRGSRGGSKN